MSARGVLVAAVAVAGLLAWRSELWNVSGRGPGPLPLELRPVRRPAPAGLALSLPAVPIGLQRVRPEGSVLVLHYWAPWEQDGLAQAQALDSLRRSEGLEGLRVALVCSDPFPSVARYVGRHRLRLLVLLDGRRELRDVLPCPSLPYTYVVDRRGRIAAEQAGPVDWLASGTRRALQRLLAERGADLAARVPPGRS